MTSAVRRDSATSPSHDIWRISLTGRRRPWKSSSRFTALPLVILVVVVCVLLFDPGNRSNANGLSILSRRNYIPLETSSGDLSVFAKKKASKPLVCGLMIVWEHLCAWGSMCICYETMRRQWSRHATLPEILLLHDGKSKANCLYHHGTFHLQPQMLIW